MVTRHRTSPPVRTYPIAPRMLPQIAIHDRKYDVAFARSPDQLRAIQRLRFEVFNVELGEGLAESFETGLDEDRFDPVCHHLLVRERAGGAVVGTYRMMTVELAREHGGFYSAGEFDLSGLPDGILDSAVEIGRACIAREHRNHRVLFLLWKGLAAYMAHNGKRHLFGCCSLTSQDPAEGKRVMDHLRERGHLREDILVEPLPEWRCYGPEPAEVPGPVHVPRLFKLYLRYGAKVCGPPAIDRFFKTIDYLCLIDVEKLDRDLYALYFDG